MGVQAGVLAGVCISLGACAHVPLLLCSGGGDGRWGGGFPNPPLPPPPMFYWAVPQVQGALQEPGHGLLIARLDWNFD